MKEEERKREMVHLPGPKRRCPTRRTAEAVPLAPARDTTQNFRLDLLRAM